MRFALFVERRARRGEASAGSTQSVCKPLVSVLESLSVANVGDSQSSLLQHGAKGNLHETDKSPFTSLSPTTLFMIVFTLSHFEVTLSQFQSLSYFQKL